VSVCDVLCNSQIKKLALLTFSLSLHFDVIIINLDTIDLALTLKPTLYLLWHFPDLTFRQNMLHMLHLFTVNHLFQ
jgi:hypothetical protein